MITGNKDIDNYILNKLDDKSLFNIRLTCKDNNKLLKDDDMFWMNRIILKFSEVNMNILRKYKKNTWLEYYKGLRKINSSNSIQYLYSERLDYIIIALNNGANIHAGEDWALKLVSENGKLDIVIYLIENGADIHANNDQALRWASRNGQLDVVKYLLENGADIHAREDKALSWASYNGHLEVVKYLVENGADIHADNDFALRYSSLNGHLEVVKYLKSL